jgi:hypothetical protein
MIGLQIYLSAAEKTSLEIPKAFTGVWHFVASAKYPDTFGRNKLEIGGWPRRA